MCEISDLNSEVMVCSKSQAKFLLISELEKGDLGYIFPGSKECPLSVAFCGRRGLLSPKADLLEQSSQWNVSSRSGALNHVYMNPMRD